MLFAALASVVAIWLLLVLVLIVQRPDRATVVAAARLPRDVVGLVRRLRATHDLPRGARVRLGLLLAYLVSPIDLIPDFIPVIGYADDIIVAAILLRGVTRVVGETAIVQAWPGDDNGLHAILRLCTAKSDRTPFP